MKRLLSVRSWLRLARLWDGLCAYTEGGWAAVHRMLGGSGPRRRRGRSPKRRPYVLALEALEVRQMPSGNHLPIALDDGPYVLDQDTSLTTVSGSPADGGTPCRSSAMTRMPTA